MQSNNNILIAQGGGPTNVINQSLVGIINGEKNKNSNIIGAINGVTSIGSVVPKIFIHSHPCWAR